MRRMAASSESKGVVLRGQIVQRVLVDGWSPAQAASVFGVGERDIHRWLSAYRRHGMASLRDEMAQRAPLRWLRQLALVLRMLRRLVTARGAEHPTAELAPFVPPRHHGAHGSQR